MSLLSLVKKNAPSRALGEFINPIFLSKNFKTKAKTEITKGWIILDNFFRLEWAEQLLREMKNSSYQPDDENLPYDSHAIHNPKIFVGNNLLLNSSWREYVEDLVGTELGSEPPYIKIRRHSGSSKGFWIHTDRTRFKFVKVAILIYLNPKWTRANGGLLQLWRAKRHLPATEPVDCSFPAKNDMNLEILENHNEVRAEVAGFLGPEKIGLEKIMEIEPIFNRMVILNCLSSPNYHSVTPSRGVERFAVVQWLF